MITNKVHGQFVRLFMQLPTEIRVQMIRLWRPVLLVGLMRNHLNARKGYGCSRGAIILERNSTTCRSDFLWANTTGMRLNKYSEHGTEEGANISFLHIRG
jgi:hypothetical protein